MIDAEDGGTDSGTDSGTDGGEDGNKVSPGHRATPSGATVRGPVPRSSDTAGPHGRCTGVSKGWAGLRVAVVGVVGVVGAVVVGCGAAPAGEETPERPAPPRVYAYTTIHFGQSILETTSDLVLVNGTEEVGRAALGLGTEPAFTTDGRYAFSLAGDEVMAISVETGKVTSVPCAGCFDRFLECQCQTVVPFGAGTVAWLDSANRLVRADLAARQPAAEPTATTAPTWPNDWDEQVVPQLLAGAEDTVLVGYPRSLSTKPGPLYLAGPDGRVQPLTTDRPGPVEEAEFSPDGAELALWGAPEADGCATVTLVEIAAGAAGAAKTSPVAASAPCAARDGYVGELWWDHDGTLNVYFQPDGSDTLVGATQRTLAGDTWVAADVDKATQEHRLAQDTTVVLSNPGVRDKDVLSLEVDGKRTTVEREVNRVVLAPR